MKKQEFEIVQEFSHLLGLPNKTDGSLVIYKPKEGIATKTKPDGYYYYEGITFILDAKKEGKSFNGQLEDYMKLEKNENFIGFKYNGRNFECYVRGKLESSERRPQDKNYYKDKYFPIKINNEQIVEESAHRLANLFRNSKINKQINIPFIGAVMLCLRYGHDIDLSTTKTIINTLLQGVENIIANTPLNRMQKKVFIKTILQDSTLLKAQTRDMLSILREISTVCNFINVSASDYMGHDIMNNFLKVFRKWNSADANEKGAVFTPDHIAQLMYELTKCSKENTILDPACGSGTFLTNAMANMLSETSNPIEQKDIKENQLIGIESDEFNATLAGINMMLHGDGASNIFFEDCFRKLPSLKDCYDRVLMNPPFSQKEEELEFVLEAMNSMSVAGRSRGGGGVSCHYLAKILC